MAKAKKNQESIEDLKNLRNELEKKVADLQTELAQKEYSIDFENSANINKVLKHLNDDVAWNTKNAALLVNLSDNLKVEKQRINHEVSTAKQEKREYDKSLESVVYLKTIDLNTLYQSLLGVQSTGIESARNYIKLLTNIGAQISEAMKLMAEENRKIQALHGELADLDKRIVEFGTPVEAELVNETSK